MKTKTINGKEFIFIEVPEDAVKFKISGTGFPCYMTADNIFSWKVAEQINLTKKHSVMGLASEIQEADWESIVEKDDIFWYYYKNYISVLAIGCHTAEVSGMSLLRSLDLEPETTLIIEKK